MSSSIFKRRGTAVAAAVFAFVAFVMIVAALLSEYWVMADLEREVGNSTQKGGSKHFGMFEGVSKQDFGLGARERDFKGKLKENQKYFEAIFRCDLVKRCIKWESTVLFVFENFTHFGDNVLKIL